MKDFVKMIKKRKYELLIILAGLIMASFLFKSSDFEQDIFLPPKILTKTDSVIIEYSKYISHHFDSFKLVGGALTIVSDSNVLFEETYGVKDLGTTDSINRHTLFRLASVSKGFAGVIGAILHTQNLLSLNDKIVKYLPEFKLKDTVNNNNLMISHTLNHTSGLVPHAYDNLAEANQTMAEILPRLIEVYISGAPGVYYGYQNVMYSLIDTVCAVALNKPYAQVVKELLFTPLGLNDASTSYIDLVNSGNYAKPHGLSRNGHVRLSERTTYYNVLPAAGINASIADMGQWLLALLGNNPDVLNEEVLDLIRTPQIQTPLKKSYTARWGAVDEKYYSLGWRIFDFHGYRIVYHGGYVRGYRAEIAFCPEQKIGIAYLQNSPNGLSSRSVPEFFKRYLTAVDTSLNLIQN